MVPFLMRLVRGRTATIQRGAGKGLRFNPGNANPGYALGTTEPDVQAALVEYVKPGDVFYDVGANVGFLSVIAARLGAHVVAFEPLPENADVLEKNASLNGLNVQVVRLALSDRDGEADLQLGDEPTWAKLNTPETQYKAEVESKGRLRVRVARLDALDLPPPDMVKLDVEGAEVQALRGMEETLRNHAPKLLIELHHTNEQIANLLERFGYRARTLKGEPLRTAAWHSHVLAIRGEHTTD
jgi:FkbM family methyltransferase